MSSFDNSTLEMPYLLKQNATDDECSEAPPTLGSAEERADANHRHARTMAPVIAFILFLMLTGLAGNVIVVFLTGKKKDKNASTYYILILAAIDLISCATMHPYFVWQLFHNYSQGNDTLCKAFGFINHSIMSISICLLTAISIDRFFAVCRPHLYILDSSYFRLKLMIALCFILGITVSTPLLVFYGSKTQALPTYIGKLGITCFYRDKYSGSKSTIVFMSIVLTCFVTAHGIIVVMYGRIAKLMRCTRISDASLSYRGEAKMNKVPLVKPSSSSDIFLVASCSEALKKRGTQVPLASRCSRVKPCDAEHNVPKQTSQYKGHTPGYQNIKNSSTPSVEKRPLEKRVTFSSCTREDPMDTGIQNKLDLSTDNNRTKSDGASCSTVSCLNQIRGQNVNVLTNPSRSHPTPHTPGCGPNKSTLQHRMKATKILFLVTLVFILCWAPFLILRTAQVVDKRFWIPSTDAEKMIENWLNHLIYINNAANPVIYYISSVRFRLQVKKLFHLNWR